jgi:conjugal transfer pilus assembly protein TraV
MITPGSTIRGIRLPAALFAPMAVAMLTGCTAVGSLMSPYSEKFSCKNPDHGQCIHPDKAYADAVAGVPRTPTRRSPMTRPCSRGAKS